tara:strand:+ start:6005 stop:6316 length:312 start_codon:yes stop_codon:yes gene_type:complete
MHILKRKNFVKALFLLFLFSTNLLSQKQVPKKRITAPDHTITSKIMDKDYQLYISFPKNYSTKDTISYPVLYVLDGHFSYPLFKGVQNLLSTAGSIEEVQTIT